MAKTPIRVPVNYYTLYRDVACLREETIADDAISLTDLESTFLHPSDYGALPLDSFMAARSAGSSLLY